MYCLHASGVFEVRATSGNTHLGGEDFDQRIMKYCISQVYVYGWLQESVAYT